MLTHLILTAAQGVSTSISLILQVRRLRHGVKWLAQGHTVTQWLRLDLNPDGLAPGSMHLITVHVILLYGSPERGLPLSPHDRLAMPSPLQDAPWFF